jgi:hypothetical protein
MGKVDQLYDAVHHGVPQGDQGIDTTQGQTVDELLDDLGE